MCIWLVLSILLTFIILCTATDTEEYGPYKVEFSEYRVGGHTAPGVTFDVGVECTDGHRGVLFHNLTFRAPVVFDVITTEVSRIKNGQKTQILRTTMRKPCTHVLYKIYSPFVPLVRDNIHNSKGNCILNKGNYVFRVDTVPAFEALIGPKCYYGEYVFQQSVANNKKITLFRLIGHFKFEKK